MSEVITCPLCNSVMQSLEDRPEWYQCTNEQCCCDDGNFSLYNKPRTLNWIKNRKYVEEQRKRQADLV